MKALVYDAKETLVYRDMPRPEPTADQALVRVMASGICGSDMHAFLGHDDRRPAPLILGHEAAGVVEGGKDDGRRVTINPLVNCGTCDACLRGRTNLCPERKIISMPPREGAFAEFVVMRRANLIDVPADVPLEHAALAEPLSCGWHAVRMAEAALDIPLTEARCLVIGGGAIGVGAALALRAFGAVEIVVTDPNALRRNALHGIEGFATCGPDAAPDQVDLVIDAVGFAATRAAASARVRPGGVIAHIGLVQGEGGLDIRRMTLQEITFFGTYTYTDTDFRDTAKAIFDGRLGSLNWIASRPLSGGQQAFLDIRAGEVAEPKIVLVPDH